MHNWTLPTDLLIYLRSSNLSVIFCIDGNSWNEIRCEINLISYVNINRNY